MAPAVGADREAAGAGRWSHHGERVVSTAEWRLFAPSFSPAVSALHPGNELPMLANYH